MTTTPADRHALAITAALLMQGKRLDALSRLLTAILLATLFFGAGHASLLTVAALIGGIGAGLVELYFSVRVGLDSALFACLETEAADGRLDIPAFDAAMAELGLAAPIRAIAAASGTSRGEPSPRGGEGRVMGIRAVRRWQIPLTRSAAPTRPLPHGERVAPRAPECECPAPPESGSRPVASRCRGARRLLVDQACALLCQVALAVGAALALRSGAIR